MKAGNEQIALVIDDLASVEPWVTCGIKIHSRAEISEENERASLIIHPQRLWSRGIEKTAFKDGKPVSREAVKTT